MITKNRKVDFFIIGAHKAGSTHLRHLISGHPEVYTPRAEVADFEKPNMTEEDFRAFEKNFTNINQKTVGIKRPTYLYLSSSARNIHNYNPEAKIVVTLRNPIKRALSAYFHNMRVGLAPQIEPNKGFEQILKYGMIKGYPRTKNTLKYGLFYKHLIKYLDLFSKKRVKIILLKDLQNNPFKTMKSVYKFLGVDDKYKPKGVHTRHMQGVYSLKRLKLLRIENRFLYKNKDYKSVISKRMTIIDYLMVFFIRSLDFIFLKPLINNDKPALDDEIKQKLTLYYKNDVKKLEKLLSRDLSYWKIN